MSKHDFEVMLRFKAEAGIVPLVAWVRELYEEYERKIELLSERKKKGKTK